MAYDYFTDDPRSVINKYKNLLTLSDLEQHKQYLTPEFYSLVKSTFDMSGVQKDRKQVTADGYADGKIQFLPTWWSTHLELKFVLVGNKNSQWYEHDDFYGYIAKNIDCFLRSRHIIHQDDIKAIILDAYQNSVYIQTQFGFDQQQAIESCMKYYKKKYIQVYHGPKKNEIFGWTSESARQKLIYMYGDAGSYTIEDKWKGGYTNRLPLDHHVKLYKKRLNNFLDTHDIKSDSEFDYASKMRIDSIQDIFDTLKKTYKAKPKNLSDQVFFDKIHKEICKNLTVDL